MGQMNKQITRDRISFSKVDNDNDTVAEDQSMESLMKQWVQVFFLLNIIFRCCTSILLICEVLCEMHFLYY